MASAYLYKQTPSHRAVDVRLKCIRQVFEFNHIFANNAQMPGPQVLANTFPDSNLKGAGTMLFGA